MCSAYLDDPQFLNSLIIHVPFSSPLFSLSLLLLHLLDKLHQQRIQSNSSNTPYPSFSDTIAKFSKYSRLKTLANLHYADSFSSSVSSIVSSIEFDKDDEFFATAGVTRKIKIFEVNIEFGAVVGDG